MDEKENECVAREAYAKTVDQQYKSKVKAYKQSKDLGRALLARLTDEEADLRRAATAWVHNFTERQRQSTSARGHCELRALWFSRARNEARALVGETVEGFSRTFFRTTLAWSLGEGCALDSVLDHKRSAVSHHEAYEDDVSDAAPEGDDWAARSLCRGRAAQAQVVLRGNVGVVAGGAPSCSWITLGLACPWGLPRRCLVPARVTATPAGWSGLGPSALSGHGDGSRAVPGAQFGRGSSGCTFLVGCCGNQSSSRRGAELAEVNEPLPRSILPKTPEARKSLSDSLAPHLR